MKTLRKDWLPAGKQAAICFSVDDVHPGTSTDAYEAGGGLERGQLGHVTWLLQRHAELRVTLFVTADWRQVSPFPTRRLLARTPFLRQRFYLSRTLPRGTMRLARHRKFVDYLNKLERVEVGLHGLHHVRRGPYSPAEFRGSNLAQCRSAVREMLDAFDEAGLKYVPGFNPPAWDLSDDLATAMVECGLEFVASARDIRSPISAESVTNMSGLKGVSLIYPSLIYGETLLHFTSNFQATSEIDRAFDIIEHGGLLAIKAHIIKNANGHVALDGMDLLYRNYLDVLLSTLHRKYGERLWWTSMGEVSRRINLNSTVRDHRKN